MKNLALATTRFVLSTGYSSSVETGVLGDVFGGGPGES